MTAGRVLEELRRVALSDPRTLFDEHGNLKSIHTLSDEAAAALASLDVIMKDAAGDGVVWVLKVKFWDKLKALEMLGKHFGLFVDRAEHREGGPLTIEVVRQMSDEELEQVLLAYAQKALPAAP